MSHAQRSALDREAPERLAVPSGNRIRLDYSDPARPVLAARIQELFGLAETPRLARGRVPVLLHLLAPNGRPQQVTADLSSFWQTTYCRGAQGARRALPRHAWPLDPMSAPAERRPRPRSGPRCIPGRPTHPAAQRDKGPSPPQGVDFAPASG